MTRWVVAILILLASIPCANAQALLADLSSHLVAITTGFTGTSVVLFGATDGPGDVIAVVRGPTETIAVRRKSRVAGMWINTSSVTFTDAPSYYALYASRPLDSVVSAGVKALHQLGVENLHLGSSDAGSAEERQTFRAALIAEQQRQNLYLAAPGSVAFLGDRLFRATIEFPRNVPIGTYLVEVFLVRDGSVVSGQTTPLVVSQSGIDADINEFAERRALLYGLLAVFGAAMAGYLASLPFRSA